MRQRITNLEAKRSAWITTTAIAGFRIVFSVSDDRKRSMTASASQRVQCVACPLCDRHGRDLTPPDAANVYV